MIMKKRYRADIKELDSVLSLVHHELSHLVSNKILLKFDVAVEEIFVNICQYAYDSTNNYVDVDIEVKDNCVKITFVDEGIPFNPLERDNPDINLPSDKRKIGGLGIFMVKKIMDNIYYKYRDKKNILTMEKKIEGEK